MKKIHEKALNLSDLTFDEAMILATDTPTSELLFIAHELRRIHRKDSRKVGWIIDRNVNITNVCVVQCKFCNFCRPPKSDETFVTTFDEYCQKIDELFSLGGDQLLLQGGLNPDLGLEFYKGLFRNLKMKYPNLKLHALSPSEIVHIAKKENISFSQTIEQLVDSGLDSLPGAGAEILSQRVRNIISTAKCTVQEWLDVMRACLLYTSPSPRDRTRSRMPSSA